MQLNALAQQFKVNSAIRIAIKDDPSRVPALCHGMRHPNGHDPCQTRHERHLAPEMNVFAVREFCGTLLHDSASREPMQESPDAIVDPANKQAPVCEEPGACCIRGTKS